MKICVLGAGALGGYFGGWLAENGADVTFVVRPARKAALEAHGLVIRSEIGALKRSVKALTQDQIASGAGSPADVVLLTAKSYDLDSAIAAIRPAVGPQTAVLPILNGISHIDRLVDVFGAQAVLGGLAKIQATLDPDGAVLHMNTWNEIVFGELDGHLSARVVRLAELFPKPQVKAQAVADIRSQMWRKLVHLGTVAAVTTLTRHSLGIVGKAADGPWLIEMTLRSAAKIADAEGFALPERVLIETLKGFQAANNDYKASMLRDMEKGGVTEGEHILGYLAKRAAAHGIDAPIFRIAAANVQTYEVGRVAPR